MIFSEVKAVSDIYKDIVAYLKDKKNYPPELAEKLNNLYEKILAQNTVEIELRQEIEEIKRQLSLKQMDYDKELGAYYSPDDKEKQEPFCQRCLDDGQKLCRLREQKYAWLCTVCNTHYQTEIQINSYHEHKARNTPPVLRGTPHRTYRW